MRLFKWLLICLLGIFCLSYIFGIWRAPRVMGKTGYDVTLAVTGMTHLTTVFRFSRSLRKTNALVLDGVVYKVTKITLPINGWNLDPDEPQYFTLRVRALPESEPAQGGAKAISARMTAVLIDFVDSLGFQGRVESIEPFEASSKLVFNPFFKETLTCSNPFSATDFL